MNEIIIHVQNYRYKNVHLSEIMCQSVRVRVCIKGIKYVEITYIPYYMYIVPYINTLKLLFQ